jgi:hypothetical protein
MGLIGKIIKSLLFGGKGKNRSRSVSIGGGGGTPRSSGKPAPRPTTAQLRAELKDKLFEILTSEYSGYELRENIDIKTIDPSQNYGGPIDFALFSGGKVVGAIMVIDGNTNRTQAVRAVQDACARAGAGFANFYTYWNCDYFPYKREYAVAYLKRQIA